MGADKSVEITGLLKAWGTGDQGALERLTELVYQELRRMARRYLRNERMGNSLQATALVNEVYLRLINVKNVDWAGARSVLRPFGGVDETYFGGCRTCAQLP